MSKIRLILLVLCCVSIYNPVISQPDASIDNVIADLIAAFVENSGEEGEFDFNTLYEKYENLKESPINLNTASRADLQELFFLSEIQISNLLDHRNKLGDFRLILELQTIPGFDLATIQLLREVSQVRLTLDMKPKSLLSRLKGADHTVYLKAKRFLEKQRGFQSIDGEDPAFLGDRNHLYLRYKMNVGNDIKMGFIAEKDAGEPYYYKDKIYGADYFSFHVYARDLTDRIRFLSLGDYAVNLGQGLIMHNGFGAGKSSLTTSIRKGGYPIRAYSSVAELNFLRGAAITLKLNNSLELTSFLSSKKRNTTLIAADETNPFEGNNISSIPLGGLNRTEAEISRKGVLRQNTGGISLKYRHRKGHIAVQAVADKFNATFITGDQLYQKFFPTGSEFINASVDYGYNFRNFNFFGEVAGSKELAFSQIHGVMIGLDKKLDFVLSYRHYSREYRSFTANSFGESPLATNEQGLYAGLEFRPAKMWIINAYVDHWKNPWAKFRVDGPGTGREYFLKIKYFKKRKWELYTQYFFEEKPRNLDGQIDQLTNNTRNRFRVHGAVKLSKDLSLRNRIEFSWYDIENSFDYSGFMVYQDVIYKPIGKNYSFNMRYAYFDIEDYDSRIYAYENDILNEYYIPAYNGRGLRFYVNTRWRLNRHITWEFRYELTRLSQAYRDEDDDITNVDFGSGNTFIEGRNRSQIKTQIKYKF